MARDPLGEALRRFLSADLEREIAQAVWEYADGADLGIEEVLEDDEHGRPSLRIINSFSQRAGGVRGLDRTEARELGWAQDNLKQSRRYTALRARIETLLNFASDVRRNPERSKRRAELAPTPYLERMALALEQPFEDESYRNLSAVSPILGGFRDGYLWIEAEPWVPIKTIGAYCRTLQRELGPLAREFMRVPTLDVYLWTRRRREEKPSETWREAMEAWNAVDHAKKYKGEANFHKDYHRSNETINALRTRVADLREQAKELELAEMRSEVARIDELASLPDGGSELAASFLRRYLEIGDHE